MAWYARAGLALLALGLSLSTTLVAACGASSRGESAEASGPTGSREAALPRRTDAPPTQDDPLAGVLAMKLPFARARQEILRRFEGRYVAAVLEEQGGNVSKAAAASGLARRYFQILKSRAR